MPCPPAAREIGDRCIEPGVQDDGCPAGTLGPGDGSCRPAGIVAAECGQGFVHDGDVGCVPVLPAEPCPPGQMAVPGDTTCRPVKVCAPGTWGDIPVDATSEHVDQFFAGMSDGTAAAPWTTIQEAVAAASSGALIAVAHGSYFENVGIMGKPVRLVGVCPTEVEIVGTVSELEALYIGGATGTEVRGIAISGVVDGILVDSSEQVVLEQLWVHDNAGRGLTIGASSGPASATVGASLFEANHEVGVVAIGSDATIEATEVRGTLLDAQGLIGVGILLQPLSDTPSLGSVRGSRVDGNVTTGAHVSGSTASFEATVASGTVPNSQNLGGNGIAVQPGVSSGAPSSATIRACFFEGNRDHGVFVSGSEATVEAIVVKNGGRGIAIQRHPNTGLGSVATLRASLLDGNQEGGLTLFGSRADVESVVVRCTLPNAQGLGRGMEIASNLSMRSLATVLGSVVEASPDVGILVDGSDATFVALLVGGASPCGQGVVGRGIQIQSDEVGAPSTATVADSRVEASQVGGVVVLESDATIERSLVTRTRADLSGLYGDGVIAMGIGGRATVNSCVIMDSDRAALSNFGAFAALTNTAIQCAALSLAVENHEGQAPQLEDRGGNACGCPLADGACKAESIGLAPPEPLAPRQ